jgi:cytidyltransferase-like protein
MKKTGAHDKAATETSQPKGIRVFVSGCYGIIHAGHLQFFEDARALGDHLTVCFASDEVYRLAKGREPALPQDNRLKLLNSLKPVDHAVASSDLHPVFDFATHAINLRPNILAVTEDDKNKVAKEEFCAKYGIKLVVLPKRTSVQNVVSTTKILQNMSGKVEVPVRVDFAGGWLDVPRLARKGGYVVNCAVSPLVSLEHWPYEIGGGLGGSAAHALLNVKNGIRSEVKLGVGWQDPAVIEETGLCVWQSGKQPVLEVKQNPVWLEGRMAIFWTGKTHHTPTIVKNVRDYNLIFKAGKVARDAVHAQDIRALARAVGMSYQAQLKEGMQPLPKVAGALAAKYLGGGHGGYALYLFTTKAQRDKAARGKGFKKIEPYTKLRTW